jgi:transketolase
MLLYALLHLTGYDLPLDELRRFRRLGSLTPGHPEHGLTPGVETTTGPLGQGFATGVGMAIAEAHLAARFNQPGHPVVDHHVYCIVGDGDLMEGISSEAASLAGHLRLGKLVCLYDSNRITIDGSTSLSFTEDVGRRFEAYGWHVQRIDGLDLARVEQAIAAARAVTDRPSLIVARTEIGYGSPNKQGKASSHGAPLGADEVRLTKERLGWPLEPTFLVPDEALARYRKAVDEGARREQEWRGALAAYESAHPDLALQLEAAWQGSLPAGWQKSLPTFAPTEHAIATRAASARVINAIAPALPLLIGGSADLAESNLTTIKGGGDFQPGSYAGRNLFFGVREHAMGAALSGVMLHGGLQVFGGTFLQFADYMRPAIRLASLMGLPVIYVFTHDSVGLGEDGPTHQPVEHLAALRAIPNLTVIRPADANETAVAWRVAIERQAGPTAIALSRQVLSILDRSVLGPADGLVRGAYVLADPSAGKLDIILIATGSEVSLALAAGKVLAERGVGARVVSMPSWELFEAQPVEYRREVLPASVTARLAIEAGVSLGWERYTGIVGDTLSVETFGVSAPGRDAMQHFGFTVENAVAKALALLS